MLLSPTEIISRVETFQAILMVIISLFGLYQSWLDFVSALRGDPMKDELTRKIRTKAASISFSISIWCWIFLMIAGRRMTVSASDIIISGVLVMGGVNIIAVMVLRIRGLRDE